MSGIRPSYVPNTSLICPQARVFWTYLSHFLRGDESKKRLLALGLLALGFISFALRRVLSAHFADDDVAHLRQGYAL